MDPDTSPSIPEKPKRKQVFFDVTIADIPIGRIIFELWYDKVPKTCENFRCLCTGEKGVSATSGANLHYKGTLMHRIIKGFMVQGGDFTKFNGTGGESIYGGRFEDEDLSGLHDRPGLLSMANAGKDTNGSQFFITCARAPHLDGNHVVFGQVMQGKSVLRFMEREPVIDEKMHRPGLEVKVANCGELDVADYVLKSEMETSKQEKKRRRRSSSSSNSDSSSSSGHSSSRRRKSRSHHKTKSSKRFKYNEDDKDDPSHSHPKRDNQAHSDERLSKEPPQPRIDTKGREIRGRGAVLDQRRHRQDNRFSSDSAYESRRNRDFRGRDGRDRSEDGKWSKIDDEMRNNGSDRRQRDRNGAFNRRPGDRGDMDVDRRYRGEYDQRREDRYYGGQTDSRSERTIEYVPTSHSHGRTEKSVGAPSERNVRNDDSLAIPQRTLVSYSDVISQQPPPAVIEKEHQSSKRGRPEVKERAGSPEQGRRHSPSPGRASDSE